MNKYFPWFSSPKKLISIIAMFLLSACGGNQSEQVKTIVIDGSSTVFPITNSIFTSFKNSHPEAQINVTSSGSLAGFEKFCQGETDINDASVPIPQKFMEQCKENGVAYIELPIAFDAITVAVNPQNDWVDTMTVEELKSLWQAQENKKIDNWQQISSDYPEGAINFFAPGKDSGTYEYFNLAILGASDSRQDPVFSEDDEVLVQGISQDINAIGYFGYAYYKQNKDQLKAVAIDNGTGGVLPSDETIQNNSYRPLARPLLIYVNAKKAQENQELAKFVEYYLTQAENTIAQVGYTPLPTFVYDLAQRHFQTNKVGTVFNGKPVINATLKELLTKTYASEETEGYTF